MKKILILALGLIILAACAAPAPTPTPAPTIAIPTATPLPPTPTPIPKAEQVKLAIKSALAASIQIITLDENSKAIATGSGSILTSDGYILTNAHVVGDVKTRRLYNRDGLVGIAIITEPQLPAVPRFIAEVRQVDFDLDLAVVKPIANLNGSKVSGLNLPNIPLGDTTNLGIGDAIIAIGFPGIGGDTVTVTRGIVSGFGTFRGLSGQWIKTDISIAPGNSGGMVISEAGDLVGVPTIVITDPQTAGQIGLVRPINLAQPIIKIALAGQSNLNDTVQKNVDTPRAGEPTLGQITFAEGVTTAKQPVNPKTNFSSGLKSLYAFFNYQNMLSTDDFGYEWLLDGASAVKRSLKWNAAASGLQYIYLSSETALPDGAYQVKLSVNGKQLRTGDATLGKPGAPSPATGGDQGVIVTGKIVDLDTSQPIPGAYFILLNPGITPSQFLDNPSDSQVAAAAKTDATGQFQTRPPVTRGQAYFAVIIAGGYQTRSRNTALTITDASPATINEGVIPLQKR